MAKYLKLANVDPERLRAVRSKKLTDRGCGRTTSRLLHMFSKVHAFNVGKSYLFVSNNSYMTAGAKEQFQQWLLEAGLTNGTQTADTIEVIFPYEFRKGLVGLWDALTKELPPTKIKFEFITAERGHGKLGSVVPVDEVILDISYDVRTAHAQAVSTATAAGKKVYDI